jgi:hypothetical protein|tara:strand:- start:65 stop:217 length:153 start_codon:yes stop_codon:yes gene_type:complete
MISWLWLFIVFGAGVACGSALLYFVLCAILTMGQSKEFEKYIKLHDYDLK